MHLFDYNFVMLSSIRMLTLRYALAIFTERFESTGLPRMNRNIVMCAAKGPRPRYPRVWKTRRRIGTISKSLKLVERIKELSNVKEEIYGALDSFIAWELEFPLITVKKALKTLENDKEWKRIIQVTKWMLSKGQGRTMGSYYTLLNALAEDDRLVEAEELWTKLFTENLDSTPRMFFEKMISIYYRREIHEKMFEIFADMEELGMRPTMSIVKMVGDVFQKLGMMDKYRKLNKKYPPPKWEYRYIKGKRVKIRRQDVHASNGSISGRISDKETETDSFKSVENAEIQPNHLEKKVDQQQDQATYSDKETETDSFELIENAEIQTNYLDKKVDQQQDQATYSDKVTETDSFELIENTEIQLNYLDRKVDQQHDQATNVCSTVSIETLDSII